MQLLVILVIILPLVIGSILFIFIKIPKLTPKKIIVERIAGVSDNLFPYRQEIQNILGDNLNLYVQHDNSALTARYTTVRQKKQELDNRLADAQEKLAPYEKNKSQRKFYDVANATLVAINQSMRRIDELLNESIALEPSIVQIQQINTLSSDGILVAYIADDSKEDANRMKEQLNMISNSIKQVIQTISSVKFLSNEFQTVSKSIIAVLQQADQDYSDLINSLSSEQFETFLSKNQSMPVFYSRFDISSYGSIVTEAFTHNPEDFYINDLFPHKFN